MPAQFHTILNNSSKSPVPKKQQPKQPKTKTQEIVTQQNVRPNTKIGFSKARSRSFPAQSLSMVLHGLGKAGQLPRCSVPTEQPANQPETKTVVIATQWRKTIDTTQKLLFANVLSFLNLQNKNRFDFRSSASTEHSANSFFEQL